MAFAKLNSMKFVGLDGLSHFWTKAKSWIAGQITAEVTAKIAEIVANAPEDLDTLKEISDWIKNHANDASAMNTEILANTEAISGKADKIHTHTKSEITDFDHTHDDRYYTESEIDTKLSGKSDTGHTHTKSEITDFPTSLPANGGTADSAKNMYAQYLDLSALDKTKFYPLVCFTWVNFAEVAICSESGLGSMEYNQNRIHFDISTSGWSDTRYTLNIREYTCYENNEITIGCIGRGVNYGAWAIWLRGGLHYNCWSRDCDLSLKTSDFTFHNEIYTVGTNYYGGANANVSIIFTPQSTITEGAYSTRPITAPNIAELEQRVAALESKA